MKTFLLLCLLFGFVAVSSAQDQHFIGKTVDQVKTLMQESDGDLSFTKEVQTGQHHFLKYENRDQTKTMLFIFSDQGRCRYTKQMCDYALLKEAQDSLNSHYEYQKDLTWRDYSEDGKYEYLIELDKREWFFTIRTSRSKN